MFKVVVVLNLEKWCLTKQNCHHAFFSTDIANESQRRLNVYQFQEAFENWHVGIFTGHTANQQEMEGGYRFSFICGPLMLTALVQDWHRVFGDVVLECGLGPPLQDLLIDLN